MNTSLERVTESASDHDIAAVVGLRNAASAVDSPWEPPATATRVRASIAHGWDGEPADYFVARDASGEAVGLARVSTSERENLDTAVIEIEVHPQHRRQGHGSRMLALAVDHARAQGRDKHFFEGWDLPASVGFAAAHGLEAGLTSIERRQLVADLDLTAVKAVREEAAAQASDYDLVRVLGEVPDSLVEGVTRVAEAMNDAPMGEIDIDDEVFSVDRTRAYERAQAAAGKRLYRVLAVHRSSGDVAGHTVVCVDGEQPAYGEQHDTAVAQAHRGHKLGVLLKADAVLWLRASEPQLRQVLTWNAESNQHMIAVNEALGYEAVAGAVIWKRPSLPN